MSGLCGWFRFQEASARSLIEAMAAPLARHDGSTIRILEGRRSALAVAALRDRADACEEGGVLAGIEGRPVWADPAQAERAKTGHARALIEGYRAQGARVLEGLGGQFALALLDEERDEALLATDRLGRRPVIYRFCDGGLVFGSTGSALQAHPKAEAGIDPQAIYDYLYFGNVPAPRTIRIGQRRLDRGELVRVAGDRLETRTHRRGVYRDNDKCSVADLEREFHDLLRQSVKASIEGASVGTFLSGGTDSSTVAGVLAEVAGSARSYSIGFQAEGYDEMEYARIASRRFGTEHHEYYVTPDDVVDAVPRIAAIHSDPFGNESAVPVYYCAAMAQKDGVDLMLAGDGGDELFAGNAAYAMQRLFGLWGHVPKLLRRLFEPVLFGLPGGDRIWPVRKARGYVRQANIPLPDRLQTYNYLERFGPAHVFEPDFLESVETGAPLDLLRQEFGKAQTGSALNRILASDLKFILADCDLPKVGRMCELARVDVTYPLLSDDLIDFAARLPVGLKLKGFKLRHFFKQALREFLPKEILTKKKHGFGLPFGLWLAGHPALQQLAQDSLADLKKRGIVRPQFIDELVRRHRSEHAKYYGVMVWILMMLEQWFRAHEDAKVKA